MKEAAKKNPVTSEKQLLKLLKEILPKATPDTKLAGKIYTAVEQELKLKSRATAFQRFCTRCPLHNLSPESIQDVRRQLKESFPGADITAKANRKEKLLAVEVALPDGAQFIGQITVRAAAGDEEEPEAKLKFVPFPVSLPGDKDLVWVLGKLENMTHPEAEKALEKARENFWESKAGQRALRKERCDRSFPEFVARVPAGILREVGLKRHYKTPEPLNVLRAPKAG